MRNDKIYIVGVDEAGRGALAGPVTVGAVAVRSDSVEDFFTSFSVPVRDSKQLTSAAREVLFSELYAYARKERRAEEENARKKYFFRPAVRFSYASTGPSYIDTHGIVSAVQAAVFRALARLVLDPNDCHVLLDGLLHAPRHFRHQETIVRGDESVAVISLASVVAKVIRDRRLCALALRFPGYGFERHKGYGTEAHRLAMHAHRLSPIHRITFCSRF